MLLEPGADRVEIVVDAALVGVAVGSVGEEMAHHRPADPELVGVQPQRAVPVGHRGDGGDHAERCEHENRQYEKSEQRSHGSNFLPMHIPPTVAAMTTYDKILPCP